MSPICQVFGTAGGVPVKVWTHDIEAGAHEQLERLATMPFLHKHVAVMPDVHLGIGCSVGTVVATKGAVIPAAVGVDLGCGMIAVRTSLRAEHLPDNLSTLRHSIERAVPVGFAEHKKPATRKDGSPAFDAAALIASQAELRDQKAVVQRGGADKHLRQVGTLGGGNHFIEICLDLEDRVWVMLHSGSRNVGKVIAEHFISKAKRHMERWFITLPDADLAYLPDGTDDFRAYVEAVEWAQGYALLNRSVMLDLVLDEIRYYFPDMVVDEVAANCHHNYISREHHFGENVLVTRKGAIRAREGDMGIIPGSMGTRSYIVRGLSNKDSFESCSHGAGRRMSRGEARRRFTVDDVAEQTRGVECKKTADVVDELPGAYKPIEQVMANQTDLVEVVAELRQVLCVKG